MFLKYMVDKYSLSVFDPDHRSLDGWTALTYATINGFTNTVEYLAIEVKCNIHNIDRFKRNCIHWAARFNNVPMFNLLVNLKVNHAAIDCESMSPLDLAKAFSSTDII